MTYAVALVTGASSGIGRSLARQLADQGTKVACVARRGDLLDGLVAEIRDHGGTALPLVADVRDRCAVHAAAAQAERDLGPIDLLIANAGIGQAMPLKEFDAAAFEDTIRTNLLGAVYAVEAVLPGMISRGAGHIVGISSLAAYRGLPETQAYGASKAALNSFLEGVRAEVRPRGVFVTTICPGFIRTPMTSKNTHPMPFLLESDEAARRILRAIRNRRRVYNFPLPMAAFTKLVHFLPAGLVDRIVGRDRWFD
ncbi:MAG TPA: SDR family NAD(P)-dependent oxidoreductase [Candidatus Polarisedimenticolaceae bacterium]|nr:SDR family NAD(P)-dependent oxidoreductase [Candidatus Polarisedimenticolaceae bacterium]